VRYRWIKGTNDFVEMPPGYSPPVRTGPIILADYGAYDCPVTGKMVEGRHAHSENLKRQGCRLLEKGETREQGRRVEESFQAGLDQVLTSAEATMATLGE
jgi:hypothetical protein